MLAHPPSGKVWSTPQRDWLKRIAAQTKANVLGGPLSHRRPRLDLQARGRWFHPFNGQLQPVLDAFNDALWTLPAP